MQAGALPKDMYIKIIEENIKKYKKTRNEKSLFTFNFGIGIIIVFTYS